MHSMKASIKAKKLNQIRDFHHVVIRATPAMTRLSLFAFSSDPCLKHFYGCRCCCRLVMLFLPWP